MMIDTQYIMRDQVRGLVPAIMSPKAKRQHASLGLMQFALFLSAAATYVASLALAA